MSKGIRVQCYNVGTNVGTIVYLQAIAGILASVAQILSLVVSSNDPETSALIYFAIAVVFILICLMALLSMMKLVSIY